MLSGIKKKIYVMLRGEIEYYRKQGVKIGDQCSFNGSIVFGSEPYLITLGNQVRCANNVTFVTHDGGMHVLRNLNYLVDADKFGTITVGDNVFIGANSIILPGVSIGNNVVIGAASVITKDVLSNSVVVGVPGKRIMSINTYYENNINTVDYTKLLSPEKKRKYLMDKFFKK